MNIQVFIEPHERREAMEAYRQWLTVAQEDLINEAPEGALIQLIRVGGKTWVNIIDEG